MLWCIQHETTWGSVIERVPGLSRGLEGLLWLCQSCGHAKWAMISAWGVGGKDAGYNTSPFLQWLQQYSSRWASAELGTCVCQTVKHILINSRRWVYRNTLCNWFQLKTSPDSSNLPLDENQEEKMELFDTDLLFFPLASSSYHFLLLYSPVLIKASFLSLIRQA